MAVGYMRFKYMLMMLAWACLAAGCEWSELPEAEEVLVVEGWIDSGDFPIVMLTTSASVSRELQGVEQLEQHLIRWAKVTVSDGEQTVVLTGKEDKRYYPPYIYTTNQMRGVPGKTYRLEVSYKEYDAVAETKVPSPLPIDSFRVECCVGDDNLCQLIACFSDPVAEKNYYKFFSCLWGKDKVPLSAFLGVVDDVVTGTSAEVVVYQPQRIFEKDYVPYFQLSDSVVVKFCQLDSVSHKFWCEYENMNSFSGNLLFPATSSLCSNIKGGTGYWFGYGSTTYYLVLSSLARRVSGKEAGLCMKTMPGNRK